MAIQFAGSNSTGNHRRRRIVATGEGLGVDASLPEGTGAEIESQLVASAAAGPWVPASESRIWAYAALIGVLLGGVAYAWTQPSVLHPSMKPLTNHLLRRSNPVLVVCIEFLFLALSAQLSHLIGWYRSRGKLDFGGRYRFWPWATTLFGIAAFGAATNTHRAFADAVGKAELLTWRSETVAWLLPICAAALPIVLFLDRDMRNSSSSLWTIRISVLLWITEAWLEVFRPEFQSQPWFESAFLLIPMFASATLFVGLWLHARIVAYVCPDPPELNERSAWSLLVAACGFLTGLILFWRPRAIAADDDGEKPKRRKKKAEASDETATKRKRKAPAKRTTSRLRTRTKSTDDEDEQTHEADALNDASEEASSEADSRWDDNENSQNPATWDDGADETENPPAPKPQAKGRITQVHKSHSSPVPAPHSRHQTSSWEEESTASEDNQAVPSSESNDETDEDRQFQLDSGMTADQMKGLSKRQKRELKRQLREQERSRGR